MRNKKHTPIVLLAPILLLYLTFIGGGLFETIRESLGYIPSLNMNEISFDSYGELFNQPNFFTNMGYSIYLALTATVLSTIIGVLIAYFLISSKREFTKRLVKKSLQMGLIIPYIYVVFLVVLFFSQTGFVSRIFYNMGIFTDIKAFPELVFDKNGIGIIWVYVFKGAPFIALFVLNVMSRISRTYEDVAKSLGANKLRILRKIYLPLCSNVIIWASCIIFAYDLGSFEVPYLLGSISPVPLSSRLYSMFIDPNIFAIPNAMAMNVVLLLIGGAVIGIYSISLKLMLRGRKL